jgi:hypothetical protein
MKPRWLGVTMILFALALLFSCGAPKEKIELMLRLQEGQSYSIRVTMDQDISQRPAGQKMDMRQTLAVEYTFDVQEVDEDGTALVDVIYTAVLYKLDGPGINVEYDSANPPAHVSDAARGFAALVGQGFSMRIAADGQVSDLQGVDAMLDSLTRGLDPVAAQSLREQFGDEALRETMEQMMAIYPEAPVGIGDSWRKQITVTKGYPIIVDTTWTLEGRREGVAVIGVRSKIKPNPGAPPLEVGGMTVSYNLSGEQEGTTELDEATGWTVGGQIKQDISGEVEALGISWEIAAESTVRYESSGP